MTDIDVYQPAAPGQYQAGIVMTPESALLKKAAVVVDAEDLARKAEERQERAA